MPNRNTLDIKTRSAIESILNKKGFEMTLDDIAFLRARIDYLNDNEIALIPDIQEAVIVKNYKLSKPRIGTHKK